MILGDSAESKEQVWILTDGKKTHFGRHAAAIDARYVLRMLEKLSKENRELKKKLEKDRREA